MKLSTPLAAVAGAIVAGSAVFFYFHSQQSGPGLQAVNLPLEQNVAGELTSQSFVNYSDGVRSALFTLKAEKGQIINLTVSGALQSKVSVFHNGLLVAQSSSNDGCNVCGGGSESRPESTTFGFRADNTGNYDVAVSGVDARAYGPFSLSAKAIKAYSGDPLKAGQSISDWATGKALEYRLNVEEEGIYSIDMRANQNKLDSYLTLLDANGSELVSDDDGGNNLDARIQTFLKPGSYTIKSDSAEGTERFQGGYTVEVKSLPLPEGQRLQPGEALTANTPAISGLYVGENISFPLRVGARELVTVDFKPQGFQAGVEVRKAEQAGNDIEYYQERARSILTPGDYVVTIGGSAQSGAFTLAVRSEAVPANAGGGDLRLNEPRTAVLLAGLDADVYTLTVTQPGNYVIDMKSRSIDSYLSLSRDGEEIAEDDDSGGNVDARIEAYLEPGEYTLRASNIAGGGGSNQQYTISAKRQ